MNVIIDYKVGNIGSIKRGLNRAGIDAMISNDPDDIINANVLFLPGVGAFGDAMKDLKDTGLIPLIRQHVKNNKLLIGICLGMQILFESSSEFGYTKGLGFLKGEVVYLDITKKVPHMGWNKLFFAKEDTLLKYIQEEDYVYFVHSYYVDHPQDTLVAYTNYGVEIPAIVRQENIIGMQFHPEKSGQVGLKLLQAVKELIG
ncbi:MAG: imidazole glycerol phosphate synthase subunit HisH [Candidatus Izimaplasma sp.]|nr:imidazole glycerol phosphate synthase subunit HisH [Candidatus Izimaplasma bacterium]